MRIEILRTQHAAHAAHWLRTQRRVIDADTALLAILTLEGSGSLQGPLPSGLRWVVRGAVREYHGELIVRRDARQVSVVEDGASVVLGALPQNQATIVSLHFGDAYLAAFRERFPDVPPQTLTLLPGSLDDDSGGIETLFRLAWRGLAAREALDDDGLAERALRAALRAQTPRMQLLDRCAGRNARHRLDMLVRLERIRSLIESDFNGALSVAQMAAIARMSRFHFIRLYARVYGHTPKRAFALRQMVVAKSMLARGKQPVVEVARALGYDNRCSFTRWVKQMSGCTPSELRRLGAAPRTTAHSSDRERAAIVSGPAFADS
jgi:AraC-like DNA-binding protein